MSDTNGIPVRSHTRQGCLPLTQLLTAFLGVRQSKSQENQIDVSTDEQP